MSKLTPNDYKSAIDVQSACNLGAIVHSFSRAMERIQEDAREEGKGTDWINNHPISRLYAEQIVHLTRNSSYSRAYDMCEIKADERKN